MAPSKQPPAAYARERRAPTVYKSTPIYHICRQIKRGTHIVHQCNALDVHVFPVERVLQQFDNVMSYRISCSKTFGPGQNFPRV